MYKINTEGIGNVKKYIWHYKKGNKVYGPFTYEDIIEMVKKGEIGPDEYVLRFGSKKFDKVSEVQELFDIIAQREEEQKEQTKTPEEQGSVSMEEFNAEFENITDDIQATNNQVASSSRKAAIIMAGAAGLCLVAWLLKLLL